MNDRRQRALEAYRDGRLSPRQRARVRTWLAEDDGSRMHLERTEALGGLVREAWSEGPPAPSADHLMAAIRPAIRRIDRERAERTLVQRFLVWLRGVPDAAEHGAGSSGVAHTRESGDGHWRSRRWEWVSGMSVATASVAVAVFLNSAPREVEYEAQHLVAMPSGPAFLSDINWPSSVYDLAEGDIPIRVYEGDAATVIYLEDEPNLDDLSLGHPLEDWA